MTDGPEHRTLRQAVLFLVVGGASAAVDAGGFVLLTRLGLVPPLASALSFSMGFVINYSGNRDLAFRGRATTGALRRYALLVVFNLGLSTALVAGLIHIGAAPLAAKVASMVLIAALNFVALRLWVFPPHPTPAPADRRPGQDVVPSAPGEPD